jgi:ferric-dicitrate binding protein FerR (iron transport regulator)
MRISRRTRKAISAEAAEWLLQFQAEGAESDPEGFSEWLLRSPAHVEEYLRVSCTWDLLNVGTKGSLEAEALVAAAKKHHEIDNVVTLRRSRPCT